MELQDRKMKILQAIIRNYLETGTVTQFDYKSDLNAKFKGKIAELKDLSTRIGDLSSNPNAIASKDANVFVTNWDTARNDGAITYKNDSMYALANEGALPASIVSGDRYA